MNELVSLRCENPEDFWACSKAVRAATAEMTWESEQQRLEAAVTVAPVIEVDDQKYRHLPKQQSSVLLHGLFGAHRVSEKLYRLIGMRNSPTLKPLLCKLGVVDGSLLPDLADEAGELGVDRSVSWFENRGSGRKPRMLVIADTATRRKPTSPATSLSPQPLDRQRRPPLQGQPLSLYPAPKLSRRPLRRLHGQARSRRTKIPAQRPWPSPLHCSSIGRGQGQPTPQTPSRGRQAPQEPHRQSPRQIQTPGQCSHSTGPLQKPSHAWMNGPRQRTHCSRSCDGRKKAIPHPSDPHLLQETAGHQTAPVAQAGGSVCNAGGRPAVCRRDDQGDRQGTGVGG